MAYQTGAAAGGADLLDKFRLFAISLGWAVNNWSTISTTQRWLSLQNAAGNFANFYWDGSSTMFGILATGFNGGALYTAQPGRSGRTATSMTAGAFPAYWFFGDANMLMCVTEISTGVFRHWGVGDLEKAGAYTGGWYMTSTRYNASSSGENYNPAPFDGATWPGITTYPNTIIRCDAESRNWWSCVRHDQSGPGAGEWNSDGMATGSVRLGGEDNYMNRSPNTINSLTVLGPVRIAINRSSSGLYSPIGTVRNIRSASMQLISPRDEIVFGTDTWKIFPLSQKATWTNSGTVNYNGSFDRGLAYKIVP